MDREAFRERSGEGLDPCWAAEEIVDPIVELVLASSFEEY